MAKEEGRKLGLILLGIVVVVAVVGLVLLYSGAKTGNGVYYPNSGTGIYQIAQQFYPSAREACTRAVQCQNGIGGVLVSEPSANPAVCVCSEHFAVTSVFDWAAVRRGEMPAPRDYNPNFVKKVIWQPQSQMYAGGDRQSYTPYGEYIKPGTFTQDYAGQGYRMN